VNIDRTDTTIIKIEFGDEWPKSVRVYLKIENMYGVDTVMFDYFPYNSNRLGWSKTIYKKKIIPSHSEYIQVEK
jgi:hypothetical protein